MMRMPIIKILLSRKFKSIEENATELAAKIRLGLKKEDVLARKAEKRMKAGKKTDPPENFPEGCGEVRDIIGQTAGVSGKT